MARSNVNRTAVAATAAAATAASATLLTLTLKLVNAYDRAEGEQPAELKNPNSHSHTHTHSRTVKISVYMCTVCVAFGIFIRFSSISSALKFGSSIYV